MNDLQLALREALAATQECNPADLDGADLELWHLCDRRCAEIVEALIARHDECGPAARAILARFRSSRPASPSAVERAPAQPPANGPAQPPAHR